MRGYFGVTNDMTLKNLPKLIGKLNGNVPQNPTYFNNLNVSRQNTYQDENGRTESTPAAPQSGTMPDTDKLFSTLNLDYNIHNPYGNMYFMNKERQNSNEALYSSISLDKNN